MNIKPPAQYVAAIFVVFGIGALAWIPRGLSEAIDERLVASVQRQSLNVQLTTSGKLVAAESFTYRSPVPGREVEIAMLAPEGTRVKAGDLLIQLDATELQQDVDRLRQELRQAKLDLQLAHGKRQDAEAAIKAVSEGEGALSVEEAQRKLQSAIKRTERLRQDYRQLAPLLERGFITRDELARTETDLEQAEEELAFSRKRAEVVERLIQPREKQRAELQLAQVNAQLEDVVGRVQQAESRLANAEALVNGSSLHAKGPGLVVYEQFLNASPRRKVRVGDRVSASQGLVTIPDLDHMMVESSVSEADVHLMRHGQSATVRLEAFPDLRLQGRVVRIGTLAGASGDAPLADKRFDLTIELDRSTEELRPDMTARVDIFVGRREQVLAVPTTAVFERQGRFVAYVLTSRGIEQRTVHIGESDGHFVEVTAGLEADERVRLTEPERPTAPLGTSPVSPSGLVRGRP
jgi:HlyD family secretion protein